MIDSNQTSGFIELSYDGISLNYLKTNNKPSTKDRAYKSLSTICTAIKSDVNIAINNPVIKSIAIEIFSNYQKRYFEPLNFIQRSIDFFMRLLNISTKYGEVQQLYKTIMFSRQDKPKEQKNSQKIPTLSSINYASKYENLQLQKKIQDSSKAVDGNEFLTSLIPSGNCFYSSYIIRFETQNELDLFIEKGSEAGIPNASIKHQENLILHLRLTRNEIFSFGKLYPEIQKKFPEINWDKSPYQQSANEIQKEKVEVLLKEAESSRSTQLSKAKTIKDDWNFLVPMTHQERLSYIFSNYLGLCLGESHDEKSSKQFLIDQMSHLKNCGVTTLFLELLTYDGLQEILNDYFTNEQESMSPILKSVLQILDSEHQLTGSTTYTEVIKSAKKAKIKVVCIETSVTRVCGTLEGFTPYAATNSMYKRILGMNYISQKIMHQCLSDGKFVALMGDYHASSSTFGQKPSIAGLAPLMNVPFITFVDSPHKEVITCNIENQTDDSMGTRYAFKMHYINMKIEGYQFLNK